MEIQKGKQEQSKLQDALLELRHAQENKHGNALAELKEQKDADVKKLAARLEKHMEAEYAREAVLETQLVECRAREERIAAECQEELRSLLELAASSVTLITECENGKYPAIWRNGSKEVVLPEGVRPKGIHESREAFPQLFRALEAAEQKVFAIEKQAQRPLSAGLRLSAERLRHTVAAAAGHYDNVSYIQNCATAVASEGCSAADTYLTDNVPKDLEACMAALCGNNDGAKVTNLLESLDVDILQKLCVLLREKALETFAPAEEQEALRREALSGLEDEQTVRYSIELKRQRDVERAAYCEAVERGRQIHSLLENRKMSLLATRMQSMSVASTAAPTSRPPSCSTSRPRTPANACMGRRSRPHSSIPCPAAEI
jgi:hypothetical protein